MTRQPRKPRRRHEDDEQQRRAIASLATMALAVAAMWTATAPDATVFAGDVSCTAAMVMPVSGGVVERAFAQPASAWGSGHRGVDIAVTDGDTVLVAPEDGTVSFAGGVAGKNVVTIVTEDGLKLSFEPAVATVATGAAVVRGAAFAVAEGSSDHCDDHCVHWGVRNADDEYLDPETLLESRRIVLKPVA
ncbi:M23 family metallopeptidase [Bifidobacterium choloepi]|uniref:M23 family metallopeptidase n=1 Tax=Bifidobacterium choloepi TaxID=2614131 RepID=A0A6I5MXT4_9BIFI|nr:M23 family metallopeptidase [Bifidobacterium choloepi]NEG69057.1 M23 family metallopeptidase [Bifidobacterium choloepi]